MNMKTIEDVTRELQQAEVEYSKVKAKLDDLKDAAGTEFDAKKKELLDTLAATKEKIDAELEACKTEGENMTSEGREKIVEEARKAKAELNKFIEENTKKKLPIEKIISIFLLVASVFVIIGSVVCFGALIGGLVAFAVGVLAGLNAIIELLFEIDGKLDKLQ